ncbi:MAG: PD-(D/E)XK nuclease family protein [Desulfobacterium sp.]|nr:PD-(D/E)XK nuclease family protein [Desulfobacterium sp.]
MADKTAYHPDGDHVITFREGPHTYTDNHGTRYLSGTGFVGRFFGKFDAEAVSLRCSQGKNPKYAGRPPGDIRAEWSAEARRGSSEGDNTHEYAESQISSWPADRVPGPISDRCTALFVQADRAVAGLLSRFTFIGAEMVIFSPDLCLSGMVDLLMYDPSTNEILILDWKQNKEISRENPWQSGLPPIDHLQATDISKYTLQLSTYQYILDRESYFPTVSGFRRALIHLTPETFNAIPLDYYDYEVQQMIEVQNGK